MLEDPWTAPQAGGALVVDETGDRKDGKATAHVGKQYLGGLRPTFPLWALEEPTTLIWRRRMWRRW